MNWRLIFFINVPVAILGTVAAILVLPAFPGRTGRRFDVLGFVTIAGGLFALLLALSKGADWDWTSYRILGLFTFSALSLALFAVIELEVDDPLLDVRVFRYGAFTLSLVLVTLVIVLLTFLTTFVVPKFAELYAGLDAELPPITQVMMAIGIALRSYLPFVVVGIGGAVAAIVYWSRTPRGGIPGRLTIAGIEPRSFQPKRAMITADDCAFPVPARPGAPIAAARG